MTRVFYEMAIGVVVGFLSVFICVNLWFQLGGLLVGAGFGGGVHAVLGNFVDAARRRLLMDAVEMIERAGAFAD